MTKCVIRKHDSTEPSLTTVTLTRANTAVVFREVPAQIRDNRGEEYGNEEITARLLATAEEAVRSGVHVDVRDCIAA